VQVTAPRLSIVFLNFNRLPETRLTLSCLLECVGGLADAEIIAVDNGSTDGTRQYLENHRHRIRVLALKDNRGIGGLNHGFALARGEYILVLDDDSHPESSEGLRLAIDYLDHHPRCGIIACQILNADGTRFRSWHMPDADRPGPSMAFVGCGFMIRRDLFAHIGWFPERFFLYQNEIAVAIQVRLSGSEIVYLPSCRIIHRQSPLGRPGWRRVYYPTRNTLWLIRQYYPNPEAVYLCASRLILGLVRTLQCARFAFFFRAAAEGLGAPVDRKKLAPDMRAHFREFRRHNSILHHLSGRV